MTSLFAARRAAEEFAGVVDGTRADEADRFAALTPTITLLREQPAVLPRAEFTADLRAALMAAADTLLVPSAGRSGEAAAVLTLPGRRTTSRPQRRLGAAAAAAVVVVSGTAGLAAAAQSALPGDLLYPVKRAIEGADTTVHPTDAGKGAQLLGLAGTRLAELQDLADAGAPAAEIRSTLASFQSSADRGSDLLFTAYQTDGHSADIGKVRDFAASSLAAVQALRDSAPPSTAPDFDAAATSLQAIDEQARTLCASCGGEQASFSGLSSGAASLNTLIALPAIQAGHDAAIARQQQALAHAAEAASSQVPTGSAPSLAGPGPSGVGGSLDTGTASGSGGSLATGTETGTSLPGTVGSTVKGTVDGVTGLLSTVGDQTGLGAVTDPVTQAVNGLLP